MTSRHRGVQSRQFRPMWGTSLVCYSCWLGSTGEYHRELKTGDRPPDHLRMAQSMTESLRSYHLGLSSVGARRELPKGGAGTRSRETSIFCLIARTTIIEIDKLRNNLQKQQLLFSSPFCCLRQVGRRCAVHPHMWTDRPLWRISNFWQKIDRPCFCVSDHV